MRLLVRNIQFLAVVILHVVTIVILIVMLAQHSEDVMPVNAKNENLYGLQKVDFIRLKDVPKIIEPNGLQKVDFVRLKEVPKIIEHYTNTRHYYIEKSIELGKSDVKFSQQFAEILVLLHKWENLNGPEKEKVAKEIETKVKNEPEVKKIIQNFSNIIEEWSRRFNPPDPSGD